LHALVGSTTGWYIGLGIGFAVVVVVVIFVALILMYAHRIADQAATGIPAMDRARENTLGVWKIQDINRSTTGIWRAAETARKVLGG
jgi:hypothetical protein